MATEMRKVRYLLSMGWKMVMALHYDELESAAPLPDSCLECPFRLQQLGGTGACAALNIRIDELITRCGPYLDDDLCGVNPLTEENVESATNQRVVAASAFTQLVIMKDIFAQTGIGLLAEDGHQLPDPIIGTETRICLKPLAERLPKDVAMRAISIGQTAQVISGVHRFRY